MKQVLLLRLSAVVSILEVAFALTHSSTARPGSHRRLPSPLFTLDPVSESITSTSIQASATTLAPQTSATSTNSNDHGNAASIHQRRRRRKYQSRRPPAVDSTLLRFVGQQKEALLFPLAEMKVTLNGSFSNPQNTTCSILDSSRLGAALDSADSNTERAGGTYTTTTSNVPSVDNDEQADSAMSWWGQYNSHRVETVLLSIDSSLDPTAVAKAGARVQAQVLARTVRRRIRTFLKERDQTWESDWVSALTIESIGYSGGHTFDESLEVMMSHGLTSKDITDILQHSPGIVLMRPRGSENGECLDDTIDRVFKLLCVTLRLRKYDARRIVRASPGLLTMRGSKSAGAVVTLLSRIGVSHNALARDKVALSAFLSRSPSSIFRLVAFLSSDAIRMPVDKIGPLLRRPVCRELLDEVAPVPCQLTNGFDDSCSSKTAGAKKDELDPWIVSALWGRQSQIRRDRTNETYRRMTRTAWTLRNEIGTADLGKVVAAYPSVLLLNVDDQILPNADYLMDNLGICEGDLPRVLQLYPKLMGLPIERMEAVSQYLQSLGVAQEDRSTVFRSFPALLTLDIEADMEPVVQFLHSIGVIDIGRFLARIPPILGYSIEKEILPKWQYLKSVSSDARFEVTKFPAFFSYPFERVIKTRYEYIRDIKKYPTQLISADQVLSCGDRDFATKVLRDRDDGRSFRKYRDERSRGPCTKTNRKQKKKKKPRNKAKAANTSKPKPKPDQRCD